MNVCGGYLVGLVALFTMGGVRQGRDFVPEPVRTMLDQRHPGWRVADVTAEVRANVGQRLGPTPGMVSGDFDGNGRADYALLIEYPNTVEPSKAFTHIVEALAFLDTGRGFSMVRLRDRQPGPEPTLFVTLQRRGTQGFDVEANATFTYPLDSIGEWYFGKAAGGSYIYRDGRFRYVAEVD